MSDEAFALLLIDNYLEKWKTRAGEEVTGRIEPVAGGAAAIATEGESTRRKQTKTAGKYMKKLKDSVSGVAGVPRASNSSIFLGTSKTQNMTSVPKYDLFLTRMYDLFHCTNLNK